MRISDWSSDVCSSDLQMRDRAIDDQPCRDAFLLQLPGRQPRTLQPRPRLGVVDLSDIAQRMRTANDAECRAVATRRERTGSSEERRVGKECVSTCGSRWSPYP